MGLSLSLNYIKIPNVPIKKMSTFIAPFFDKATSYSDRLFVTGVIVNIDTTPLSKVVYINLSEDIAIKIGWLPISDRGSAYKPHFLESKIPPVSNDHVNPFSLTVQAAIGDIKANVLDFYENPLNPLQFCIILDPTAPNISNILIGDSIDLLYPLDTGIRYKALVGSISSDRLTLLCSGFDTSVLDKVLTDTTFDIVFLRKNTFLQRVKIVGISYNPGDVYGSVGFTLVDEILPDVLVGDIVILKSSKWTGFCNPSYDPFYDSDLNWFDSDYVNSVLFDYSIDSLSGVITWHGNSVLGSSFYTDDFYVDLNSVDKVKLSPSIPYSAKLSISYTINGTESYIDEREDFILTSRYQDASVLHHHDTVYGRSNYQYNHETLSNLIGGDAYGHYHISLLERNGLNLLLSNS